MREFWQLNVDLFGDASLEAEVEIISLAVAVMDNFGIPRDAYDIPINHRGLLNAFLEKNLKNPSDMALATRLLDKYEKDNDAREKLYELLATPDIDLVPNEEVVELLSRLKARGIEAKFHPTLTRGFDYYSGIVFEIFDKHPDNNRSLFGGGRYNNLLDMFGEEAIPAVGFGMGDLTIQNMLETHSLLPQELSQSTTDLCVALVSEEVRDDAEILVNELRARGVNVVLDISGKKLGDQIKKADTDAIPFVLIVGPDEIASQTFTLKDLSRGDEIKVARDVIADTIGIHA
jgi:histidyl-tRNA synthetase